MDTASQLQAGCLCYWLLLILKNIVYTWDRTLYEAMKTVPCWNMLKYRMFLAAHAEGKLFGFMNTRPKQDDWLVRHTNRDKLKGCERDVTWAKWLWNVWLQHVVASCYQRHIKQIRQSENETRKKSSRKQTCSSSETRLELKSRNQLKYDCRWNIWWYM